MLYRRETCKCHSKINLVARLNVLGNVPQREMSYYCAYCAAWQRNMHHSTVNIFWRLYGRHNVLLKNWICIHQCLFKEIFLLSHNVLLCYMAEKYITFYKHLVRMLNICIDVPFWELSLYFICLLCIYQHWKFEEAFFIWAHNYLLCCATEKHVTAVWKQT
jgi:hypothetical protein